MEKQEKIFIGVSWPYANGSIHIGHLAGQNIACDVFARYHRQKGNKVLMVSGSDSHGAAVTFKAEELGISPEKYAAQSHENIVKLFEQLGLIYENYTKTTTETHKAVVQNVFLVLHKLGYLEEKVSEQYFDEEVQRFLPDRYVRGTCPECSATNARGDECPECGEYLEPEQLLDPYSTLSDTKPVIKETKHFYLNLSKVQGEIEKWVGKNDKRWRKWVREFTKGWLKQGLQPRSVTRDLDFGIEVPLEGWNDKVIYVWIEAVVGYLSAAIEWAQKNGNPSEWEDYWKDPKCKHYYFIAGGNVPFHTILWPAEIVAYNNKYKEEELNNEFKLPGESNNDPLQLPYNVPANKMLFFKGKKISKGDGTTLTVESLLDRYSPDVLRYFFLRYGPENHDREYTWKDFIDVNNNELVANIGNFINRTITFTHSKFDGKIPEGSLSKEVKDATEKAFKTVGGYMEETQFVKSIEAILELGDFANKYFNDREPWVDIKENKERAKETMYNSVQLVNAFRILLKPYLPFATEKLRSLLNIPEENDPNIELERDGKVSTYENQWTFVELSSGQEIKKPEILFEKLEYTEEMEKEDTESESFDTDSVEFIHDKKLRKDIPVDMFMLTGLNIKRKSKKVSDWLKGKVEEIEEKYEEEGWKEKDRFKGFRELHSKYTDEKFIPSSEKLVRFVKEKGSLPNINTFVDIYNVISALTGVSIGAHDLERIKGNPRLTILSEDTPFTTIQEKENMVAKKGEYAYVDDHGILCRLDIKQGERTKVTENTKHVLILLQGHENIGEEKLENAKQLLTEALTELIN